MCERICPFAHKNTPRSSLPMSGALKTMFVFSLRQDPCRNRSYAAGGARYLHADLMLLTHAGCAFKDPHGCFGISGPGAPRRLYGAEQGNEIRKTSFGRGTVFSAASPAQGGRLVQFRTAALRRNRQCGAAAPLSFAGAGCRCFCHPGSAGREAYLYSSTRRVRCS